jgi:hypothetical protein
MNRTLITLLALGLAAPTGYAADDEDADSAKPKPCPATQASTVFVPDKAGNRQKGSAEKLREAHTNAQNQGWEFKDLEIYIEDGDLQGFFVTYTRPHPCNAEQ